MADTRRSLSSLQTLYADNIVGDISAQDGRDALVSSHPENVIQTGTVASIPATGQLTGDLYLPSNGFHAYRWSGSAWAPWGPVFPMTDPSLAAVNTWINQGGASVSSANGGLVLTGVVDNTLNLRGRVKSAPATPYTVTVAFLPSIGMMANYQSVGLWWRQSSDGKLVTFNYQIDSTSLSLLVSKWTNHTTFSAAYKTVNVRIRPLFFRIDDDGTNRICSYSADGVNFVGFHSIGRTDFLTADQVGFFVEDRTNTYTPIMTVLSWKEA